MEHFHRIENNLYCENVPLESIASCYGTPTYVYSTASIQNKLDILKGCFHQTPVTVCYSVKSNSNLSLLKIIADNGCGADIVSGGELFRALKAGIPASKIVYSGVGKTEDEIRFALSSHISLFNVESEPELNAIERIASQMQCIAPIALRVNPDIDAQTHHHTTTGKKENKFGIPFTEAVRIYKAAAASDSLNPSAIDVHLGSPIPTLAPYEKALALLSELILMLRAENVPIRTLDIGGGLAIVYNNETPFTPLQFGNLVSPVLEKLECNLIVEPGRYVVGNSGALLTNVTYVKTTAEKTFYLCDAGMNDLIRPAFYDSYHRIEPLTTVPNEETIPVDVVGPICESSDYFAKARMLPLLKNNDTLAILSAGAYGFSMASNYNSRPRAAEVLVDGNSHTCIRKRETYEDLVRHEIDL